MLNSASFVNEAGHNLNQMQHPCLTKPIVSKQLESTSSEVWTFCFFCHRDDISSVSLFKTEVKFMGSSKVSEVLGKDSKHPT